MYTITVWSSTQPDTAEPSNNVRRKRLSGGIVHDLYFNPRCERFQPRTLWSLSNAFASAFKELDPIPQFKATAKLGAFLEALRAG